MDPLRPGSHVLLGNETTVTHCHANIASFPGCSRLQFLIACSFTVNWVSDMQRSPNHRYYITHPHMGNIVSMTKHNIRTPTSQSPLVCVKYEHSATEFAKSIPPLVSKKSIVNHNSQSMTCRPCFYACAACSGSPHNDGIII